MIPAVQTTKATYTAETAADMWTAMRRTCSLRVLVLRSRRNIRSIAHDARIAVRTRDFSREICSASIPIAACC